MLKGFIFALGTSPIVPMWNLEWSLMKNAFKEMKN